MSGAWFCQVKNLWIDGNNVEGVIGIRYDGGWDRYFNSGKVDLVEGVHIWKCDVGMQIGGLFGPDLVGSSFRNIWIWQVRIGVRVISADVAMMQFYNMNMSHYRQAGFQLIGHSGRVIRYRSEAEKPIPKRWEVLREPDGKEVFFEEIEPYLPGLMPVFVSKTPHPDVKGSGERYWVGGGYPEIVIYGLGAHSDRKEAWLIDTNWAPVRIYSARIECPGGVLRFTSNIGGLRHNVVLVDVSATSRGEGAKGNVIEFHGKGPLYLIGCSLNGSVALGSTQVFSTGTHFMKTNVGFVNLPGASAVVHESHAMFQCTVAVPKKASSVKVKLEGMHRQPDRAYQVMVTPDWNAGSVWVTDKGRDGFTIHFEQAPTRTAQADILVTRTPFRNSDTEY